MSLRSLAVGADRLTQRTTRVMESRFRRTDGDVERIGDLGEREAEEVVMDDDGAVVRREPRQAAVDRVAVGQRARGIGRGTIVIRQQADVRLVTAATPRLVAAGVHEQAT